MGNIKLSICIPTYNFGEFIGETLESIIRQAGEDVEIVVGDGASTDNTEEVVRRYQADYPRLIYRNLGKKGGIDLDIAKTVDLASGDYCWLMSSDDVLKPGAIDRILGELQFGHSIYLCNRTNCDRDLNEIITKYWLPVKQGDWVFDFSNAAELRRYLKGASGLGAIFSYISSLIVRRDEWNSINDNQGFLGCNYAHVHRLFSIAKRGGRVMYIKTPLILARHYNDSFMSSGIAKRFLIDLNGYDLLMKSLFDDAQEHALIKLAMRREHKWYFLAGLRNKVGDDEWLELERRFVTYGYHPAQLLFIRMLGSSNWFMSSARRIRQTLAG